MPETPHPAGPEDFLRFRQCRPEDLFEGALAVARLIDPRADVDGARARVAELASRVSVRRAEGSDPLDALRNVLFTEERFSGDAETYDAPENSSVVRVLAARRGMPITLAIVVLEIGRRAGVRLEGIGLPGHFVVGGADLPEGKFLDPFDGGQLRDAAELTTRVAAILGTPVALPSAAFAPDREDAILRRVLANLTRSFLRRDQAAEARRAAACGRALGGREASGGSDAAEEGAAAAARKRTFTLEEARTLLPQIRERTDDAVQRFTQVGDAGDASEQERQAILLAWAKEMAGLGVEIKGPWLVDFDSGSGYYCWKYPERGLAYFHGYEEGFAGRLPLQ